MGTGKCWKKVAGLPNRGRFTTLDGRRWRCVLFFELEHSEVAMLFSREPDLEIAEGNETGHSVAVYVRGDVSEEKVDDLVQKLTAKL